MSLMVIAMFGIGLELTRNTIRSSDDVRANRIERSRFPIFLYSLFASGLAIAAILRFLMHREVDLAGNCQIPVETAGRVRIE